MPAETTLGTEVLQIVENPSADTEFVSGNTAEILINGSRFFPAMLAAMRGAKKTITLETYIWVPGEISEAFITTLCERAQAGVKVHVLVDGMGTLKFKREDRERLEAAGVEYHKYHRKHWWHVKANINHRTHRKILVVDGTVGFTGGMCIDDRWLGDADSPDVWRETQVRVTGPVVAQLQAAFAVNWTKTTSDRLEGEDYFPPISSTGQITAKCSISGPGEGSDHVERDYVTAISNARKCVDIANAYFIPDDLAIEAMVAARERGVRVRVVAPAINDSRFGRAASRSRWGKLLAAGVEFHLYHAAMYHAKTMAVDDRVVVIGSANFDHRSFRLNDEILANFIDPTLAAAHRAMFERDVGDSHPLTLAEFRSRPIYIKIADHLAGMFRYFL